MNIKDQIKAEIERLIEVNKTKNGFPAGTICAARIEAYKVLLKRINSLPEEKPSEDLEKAARMYAIPYYMKDIDVHYIEEYPYDSGLEAAFIAGAEWQKEQDQPITGNSLEQEWLRYVDKRKKENRGELPIFGEYGWLQIARHFAEWQKEQMMKDAVEGEVMLDYPSMLPTVKARLGEGTELRFGDKVKCIVMK